MCKYPELPDLEKYPWTCRNQWLRFFYEKKQFIRHVVMDIMNKLGYDVPMSSKFVTPYGIAVSYPQTIYDLSSIPEFCEAMDFCMASRKNFVHERDGFYIDFIKAHAWYVLDKDQCISFIESECKNHTQIPWVSDLLRKAKNES